jgi:hypothetical protein
MDVHLQFLFEKHYKKSWYFSIGKPNYQDPPLVFLPPIQLDQRDILDESLF